MNMTKHKIEVMQAYVDGQLIEWSHESGEVWVSLDNSPVWNWQVLDYRVKPPAPPTPDLIPWDCIAPRFNYAARDENGWIFAYEQKPVLREHPAVFGSRAEYFRIDHVLIVERGTIPWTASLQTRPGFVE